MTSATTPSTSTPPTSAVRPTGLDPQVGARLKRDRDGLVAAVAQQHDTGEVLMVGWMDDEALHRTLTTGRCTYWSRSRQEYWVKGDTSGAQQWVKEVRLDCDGDTVLVKVDQAGSGACHTGDRTCFDATVLPAVHGERSSVDPAAQPDGSPGVGPDTTGATPGADPTAASPT